MLRQDTKITMITQDYYRTESGKSWQSKPTDSETEVISREQYHNITNDDTLRFFRRLGGSEYPIRCYTQHGYIIVQLNSCNPDRSLKRVRTFEFD